MLDEQMLKNYHTRRIEDLALCRKALEGRNLEEIANVGHKLKGNGEMFGYPELSKLGAELESSALKKDVTQVENCLNKLALWIEEKK